MSTELYRGLKDGRVVYVMDVERGLACSCTCPSCGARLIARQGKVRRWHFAHHEAPECDVATAAETALHMLAKKILVDAGRMQLPPAPVLVQMEDCSGKTHTLKEEIQLGRIRFDSMREEHELGPYRIDVLADYQEHPLAIEIKVTHAVDEAKIAYLRKNGISTIEIDLSNTDRNISDEALRQILVEESSLASWLFSARAEKRRAALARQLRASIEELDADIRKEQAEKEAARQRLDEERKRREKYKRDEVSRAEILLNKYLATGELPDTDPCKPVATECERSIGRLLHIDSREVPWYLDVDVPSTQAFAVAPWIWQGRIFYTWLLSPNAQMALGKRFRTMWVLEWARKTLPIPRFVRFLDYPDNRWCANDPRSIPNPYEAIGGYLSRLEEMGFLKHISGDMFVVRRNDTGSPKRSI